MQGEAGKCAQVKKREGNHKGRKTTKGGSVNLGKMQEWKTGLE